VRFFAASSGSSCAIGKERGGEREGRGEGGMKGGRKREEKLVSEKVGQCERERLKYQRDVQR
jgi:hypothetical protein